MIYLDLEYPEKKLIQKIIKIQLQNLHSLLPEGDNTDQTLIFCSDSDSDYHATIKQVQENIRIFRGVFLHPNELLFLDDDNLSIVKHILNNFIGKKYSEEKKAIWRALYYKEFYLTQINPN